MISEHVLLHSDLWNTVLRALFKYAICFFRVPAKIDPTLRVVFGRQSEFLNAALKTTSYLERSQFSRYSLPFELFLKRRSSFSCQWCLAVETKMVVVRGVGIVKKLDSAYARVSKQLDRVLCPVRWQYRQKQVTVSFINDTEIRFGFAVSSHRPGQICLQSVLDFSMWALEWRRQVSGGDQSWANIFSK